MPRTPISENHGCRWFNSAPVAPSFLLSDQPINNLVKPAGGSDSFRANAEPAAMNSVTASEAQQGGLAHRALRLLQGRK